MAIFRDRIGARSNWRLVSVRALWVLVVFCVLTMALRVAPAQETAPDLETIRATVDSYANRVKTLEGKYVMTLSRDPRSVLPVGSGTQMQELRTEATFVADIVRGAAFVDKRDSYWLPGKNGEKLRFETHEKWAFDGATAYRFTYSHVKGPVESELPADTPLELSIGRDDPISNQPLPWDFAGLRIFGRESLSAVMRDSSRMLCGEEEVNGMLSVRLADFGEGLKNIELSLDPEHEYLPRQIFLAAQGFFEVSDFAKFADEQSGSESWFPVRCRMSGRLGEIKDFEVTELKINPPIDAARLSIHEDDLPDGVKVVRGIRGSVSFTGERDDLWEQHKRLFDDEARRIAALVQPELIPAGATGNPAGLRSPAESGGAFSGMHWSYWAIVAVLIGFIVATGVVVVRARRR
jgi:hypothetical protein